MNARIVLFLSACSVACAEVPPVVETGGNLSGNSVVNVPNPVSSTANYEMMKRIEQMQAEVQQLTGKVEEQAFQIEELKKKQKTMYTDFDDRLQGLENKSATGQPSADNSPTPDTSADSTGQAVAAPAVAEQQTKANPSENAGGGSVTPAQADNPAPVSEAEKQEYQQAYDALRNGRTSEAIAQFNIYLTAHPQSGYASNAQYWLGEAHRVNQDNASARKAFNDVVAMHPESAKVPDALLKLGYIEVEEKNSAKAREYLTRVTTEYPASKAARLAEKKLLTLDTSTP
ncbi:MAG: tol-pal system protein YbgF [Methyloglobulus sp.]|nr:tol-pal system protein YbgF [Methyloglobulus sp.]